ncbi:MAG: biotin--[acetyl-CoA-carboxylase] ligase [Anaerolineae bacterium]
MSSPSSGPLDGAELTGARVRSGLAAERLGATITVVQSVGSTMDAAAEIAREGAPDGAVVIADFQSAGRGRLDRTWEAPPGTALLMSVLLRPDLPRERLSQVQMAFSLAVADVLDAFLAEGALRAEADDATRRTVLKWPNDVLALGERGGKIAGLLSEVAWADDAPRVIVGLGVNVSQEPDQLPPGATSLAVLGIANTARSSGSLQAGALSAADLRAHLAAAVLNAADANYSRLLAGESLVDQWAGRLVTIGRRVVVHTVPQAAEASSPDAQPATGVTGPSAAKPAARSPAGASGDYPGTAPGRTSLAGVAVGVAATGELQVRTDGGDVVTVRAGDVTLAPDEGTLAPEDVPQAPSDFASAPDDADPAARS